MKTKREVLEQIIEKGYCVDILCGECPYAEICGVDERLTIKGRLQRIGAMAILRMFKEKEEPLLSVGTKIRFSNKEIATVTRVDSGNIHYYVLVFEDGNKVYTDYLIGKTWEVVK